mgnify:FL=1
MTKRYEKTQPVTALPDTPLDEIRYDGVEQHLIQSGKVVVRTYKTKFCCCGDQILAKMVFSLRSQRWEFVCSSRHDKQQTCSKPECVTAHKSAKTRTQHVKRRNHKTHTVQVKVDPVALWLSPGVTDRMPSCKPSTVYHVKCL